MASLTSPFRKLWIIRRNSRSVTSEVQNATTQGYQEEYTVRVTGAPRDLDLIIGSCELVSHFGNQRDPAYEEYEQRYRNERLRLR
ncbi:hypothetical protein F5Y06DRAFT_280761 [Hypoxylon sp. FL0890]|nr:hypothetical protein F5Y06DRAFT_280761 [Hypoxylon sp. FL0890]